jgi:acyl-CoA thioesterase
MHETWEIKGIVYNCFIDILPAAYFIHQTGLAMNFQYYQNLVKQDLPLAIDSSWGQGRNAFGGLTSALVLTDIEKQTGLTDADLRTINIHFCGAVILEQPCQFTHRILSKGKSVIQIEGQLLQEGQVKTQVVACFGAKRQSSIQITPKPTSPAKSVSDATTFPSNPSLTPQFAQYFDMRLTSGSAPFSGAIEGVIGGWMRFKEPTEVLNDSAMLVLIDAWPPAVLPMLTTHVPASTITWNLEFIQPRDALAKQDYLYYECKTVQADMGYAHTEAIICHPNGQLLALSRQLVGVYDKRA